MSIDKQDPVVETRAKDLNQEEVREVTAKIAIEVRGRPAAPSEKLFVTANQRDRLKAIGAIE